MRNHPLSAFLPAMGSSKGQCHVPCPQFTAQTTACFSITFQKNEIASIAAGNGVVIIGSNVPIDGKLPQQAAWPGKNILHALQVPLYVF